MDALAFLICCIVILLVGLARVYRTGSPPAEESRSAARLAALLDADVLAAVTEAAREEGVDELRLVNDRLRASFRPPAP